MQQCNIAAFDTIEYHCIKYNTIAFYTIKCNCIQYNAIAFDDAFLPKFRSALLIMPQNIDVTELLGV